jgi:hypothetical protein
MARQPYPLEALRKLRDERAEELAQRLAEQVARSQAAEVTLRERGRVRRDHAERTADTVRSERARLAAGGVSGAELLRCVEFEAAAASQAAFLLRAEAEAQRALSVERAREQELRAEQARREAEAELVRHHEASFRQRQAELVEKAEEEVALEQWNARRH